MNAKKRCFMRECGLSATHLRRHLVGRHLPPCSAFKNDMELSARMLQFHNILMSVGRLVGCRNVFDLCGIRSDFLMEDSLEYRKKTLI